MLTMQWQCLVSLTTISILIINCPKKIVTATPLLLSASQANLSFSKTLLTDNSLVFNKQNQDIKLFQQLNLTPEQTYKINQIHRRYQRQLIKKDHILTVLQQQLSDLMLGTATEDLLIRKYQRLTKIRQEINTLRFQSILETRQTLTLQQRQKFRDLVKLQLEQ